MPQNCRRSTTAIGRDLWVRILYGVQTTGQGHLVRSTPIIRALRDRGHEVDVLTCAHPSRLFGQPVILHFTVYDRDDLRGALKPDARGRLPRGSVNELQTLVDQGLQPPPQP